MDFEHRFRDLGGFEEKVRQEKEHLRQEAEAKQRQMIEEFEPKVIEVCSCFARSIDWGIYHVRGKLGNTSRCFIAKCPFDPQSWFENECKPHLLVEIHPTGSSLFRVPCVTLMGLFDSASYVADHMQRSDQMREIMKKLKCDAVYPSYVGGHVGQPAVACSIPIGDFTQDILADLLAVMFKAYLIERRAGKA